MEIRKEMVLYSQSRYENDGRPPSLDDICSHFDLSREELKKVLEDEKLIMALELRGIYLGKPVDYLDPQQLRVANMILNPADPRTLRQKLKEAKVTPATYNSWKQSTVFNDYLRKRAEFMFGNSDPEVYKSLVDKSLEGDVSAMKLFFEMRNIYNPRVDINININYVLVKIVEIIAKHVEDEDTLTAISYELEQLNVA